MSKDMKTTNGDMPNKHKHYDMIVAKAANMDLVRLSKVYGEWIELAGITQRSCHFNKNQEHFLCLPQHKEAVLCRLNEGSIQIRHAGGVWNSFGANINGAWGNYFWYMSDKIESRVKPKKEKRWIAVNVSNGDTCMCTEHSTPAPGYQIIEIEVEL